MGLRIQNNVEAFNTHRQLVATSSQAAKSMEKLSSGYRINRAADDAAGLAISEKMRGQIGGLGQAQRNAQDGISLVQTAEGALSEVHSMLQRVRDLKVQSLNGTLSTDDQDAIVSEVVALAKEMYAIGDKTQFNGKDLLKGGTFAFQVGANDGETITTTAANLSGVGGIDTNADGDYVDASESASTGLGDIMRVAYAMGAGGALGAAHSSTAIQKAFFSGGATLVDADGDAGVDDTTAGLSLDKIDTAIKRVSQSRSDLGAVQNRLEHRLNNLATYQENLTASESRIRDVDMASEMTKFTKLNILQQAGTSMLAQANQAPQGVLSLLR
jgi:flagellin